jgi:hypothetical protein
VGVIAVFLCLAALVAIPQDPGTLDVPVYRNEVFGVALPRPFPDWVFSPGGTAQTTTVLFHPRQGSLREQLWGALVLTAFDGPVPLNAVADQRLQTTWQPALGRSFAVLTRDSLQIRGFPALHLVMSGAVNRLAVDVEEYFIARGSDLVILQFRYPRGLPRDSVAAGYQHAFDGLEMRRDEDVARVPVAVVTPAPTAETAIPATSGLAGDERAGNRRLAGSPWRARAYETLVRFDPGQARADFSVRIEVVNEDVRPRDSLAFVVRGPFQVDGARSATGQRLPIGDPAAPAVRLPHPVDPQAATAITVDFHLVRAPTDTADDVASALAISRTGVRCLIDWLPRVAAWTDSAGHAVAQTPTRFTVRFDVPESFTAISVGRLAADFTAGDRRRVTWLTEDHTPSVPAFVIGALRRVAMRTAALLTVRIWAPGPDSSRAAEVAGAIVETVRDAWAFYSLAFGRLTIEDVDVTLAEGSEARAAGSTIFLSPGAPADSVRVAVARIWWGETVRFEGPGARWLADALSAWSLLQLRAAEEGDSVRQRLVRDAESRGEPVATLEAARRAVGDARFRVAVRTFFLEHRRTPAGGSSFLALLGGDVSPILAPSLQGH